MFSMIDTLEKEEAKKMIQSICQIHEEKIKLLDKLKDEFLSNISHELKTPLVSIKGYSEILHDETLGSLNNQQKKALSTVLRNSERLIGLVDALLYVSEAKAGNVEHASENIQIKEVIDNIILKKIPEIKTKDLEIKKNICGNFPLIRGDKGKLSSMLIHLLNNAIKFTSSGGRITVSLFEENNDLHIAVSDTGIGIPEEQMPKLFQKFYQIDGSTTRRYGGTGMGLHMCKTIVESHNGEIWIESEKDVGTTVHVRLPTR